MNIPVLLLCLVIATACGGKQAPASHPLGGMASTGGQTALGGPLGSGGVRVGGTAAGGALGGKTYYVATTGKPVNDGASFASAMDYATAFAAVKPGERILMQAGTYSVPFIPGTKNTITLANAGTAESPIRIETFDHGRAVLDFGCPEQTYLQDGYGLLVSGSYYSFQGLDITRAAYQGVYVTGDHNTFENCAFHDNRNTGLEINQRGSNTTVKNCDAYRNYDPKKSGSMADGFGPKQTQGPGNKFIGCRAWENSDDGYDAYDSSEAVTFEDCWAIRNGVDVWNYGGFAGNGNGFKVGGNAKVANHNVTRCVAFGQPKKGFDQNNNAGGVTLYNNTGYQNGINFGFGGSVSLGQKHVIKNNLSLAGGSADAIANALTANNSWEGGLVVSEGDFLSVDTGVATLPRHPDGTLPIWTLFHLTASSALIDKGIDVGLPFSGAAPDLGAFEGTPLN